jgi:hypothetical protein
VALGFMALRTSRIGYPTQESTPLMVRGLEVLEVDLRMSVTPIPLEEISVEVARTALRNASTYEGLYARRARANIVGRERVLVRDDPEMRNVGRVRDVLRLLGFQLAPSRSVCVNYYLNGLSRDSWPCSISP